MPKPIPYMTKLILHPPQHISHKPHPHKFALHPYKKPTSLTAPQRNKKKRAGWKRHPFSKSALLGFLDSPSPNPGHPPESDEERETEMRRYNRWITLQQAKNRRRKGLQNSLCPSFKGANIILAAQIIA